MQLHPATLSFLSSIKEHNSRQFFAFVRPLYDEIYTSMQEVCQAIITEGGKIDDSIQGLTPKNCMFRIYRDARKLKKGDLIYKQNRGFSIAPGGKNSDLPGYYLHIQPGNQSFFGGGIYWPDAEHLRNLRHYFSKHGDQYEKIISNKTFKKSFSAPTGNTLVRPPLGFSADSPYIELIKYKQHLIYHPISDKDILSMDIIKYTTKLIEISYPWMNFLLKGCTTPPSNTAKNT